jgi:hypothetical protein
MKEISVTKACNMVANRSVGNATLRLPYKMRIKDHKGKVKKKDTIPLQFLFNAIGLNNLKHPETEDCPASVDIGSIDSCYIFGSAIKPRFEKIVRKYLFGLYVRERDLRIEPNDLDIMCFVNNGYDMRHIRSMTSWEVTISGGYGSHQEARYGSFDISYIPSSLVYDRYEENEDFLGHIRECGACIMGSNIVGAKRYASWSHDTIKDKIYCNISREKNVSDAMVKRVLEDNRTQDRFEMMDL